MGLPMKEVTLCCIKFATGDYVKTVRLCMVKNIIDLELCDMKKDAMMFTSIDHARIFADRIISDLNTDSVYIEEW